MAKRVKKRAVKTSSANSNTLKYVIIGAIVVAVVGLGYLLFASMRGPESIAGLVTFPRPSQGHDNTLVFNQEELPPAGGEHYDVWLNCGIYSEPVETGNVLHSLEHGAVWITYQPDLSPADVTVLEERAAGEEYLILSPYPGQRSPVVLTAWGLQLEVDSVSDERINQFIERYQNGPQTPEPGASCRDGAGAPMSY